jgi:hypothetical protein
LTLLCASWILVVAAVGSSGAAASASTKCPLPSALLRPSNPRGAIQAAKAYSYGHASFVLDVQRGPDSPYASSAGDLCGSAVLGKSVYVEVHPAGTRCAACNFHGYLVKYKHGPWKVWVKY